MLKEAEKQPWMLYDQNNGQLPGWLVLLPFSDRPRSVLDALDLLEQKFREPWQLHPLLSALGYAPAEEAEDALRELAQRDPRFLSDYDWFAALETRRSESALRILLQFLFEGEFSDGKGGPDRWRISKTVEYAMHAFPSLREEIYRRFPEVKSDFAKAVLRSAISEGTDPEGLFVLIDDYCHIGKGFDGTPEFAIRHIATEQRPAATWSGAYEIISRAIPDVRKKLFDMARRETPCASLAARCLVAIDEIRDEYGPAESEPRHPNIEADQPWPFEARISI